MHLICQTLGAERQLMSLSANVGDAVAVAGLFCTTIMIGQCLCLQCESWGTLTLTQKTKGFHFCTVKIVMTNKEL